MWQCVMFNLNGQQPAAVTNISLCFGLTITILVYSFAGTGRGDLVLGILLRTPVPQTPLYAQSLSN